MANQALLGTALSAPPQNASVRRTTLVTTIHTLIVPLRAILARPELLRSASDEFQKAYWAVDQPPDEPAWDILGDLATVLEYYEPNPEWRKASASFYDDEGALSRIRSALQRLQDECGITKEPCA